LTDEDFADLTRMMLEIADQFANGRVVSVLEGGYNLDGLSMACKAHCRALAEHGGLPTAFDSPPSTQSLIPPSGFDEFEW
jgi:acetoin utilization deacetylase AcuC-like enzyme